MPFDPCAERPLSPLISRNLPFRLRPKKAVRRHRRQHQPHRGSGWLRATPEAADARLQPGSPSSSRPPLCLRTSGRYARNASM